MKKTCISLITLAFLLLTSVFACSETSGSVADDSNLGLQSDSRGESGSVIINGAGATFPYPVYAKWTHTYHGKTGVKLNYQSIGSGGGIAQIKARTVNFGASDAPLSKTILDALGLIQFPLIIGGVVPVVNVEGIEPGSLKLTQSLLADIFLGKVKKWNDKAVRDVNPNLNLPDKDIAIVHRADGSGTTWIFTHFLTNTSKDWADKVGAGKAVEWPTGMGGKGNEGVAAYVQRVSGSIGYVEFAYALQNNMSHVLLQNRSGTFVEPNLETFTAAAINADWKTAPGFNLMLTDQTGHSSWPITGASFILMYKKQKNRAVAKKLLEFFKWCYRDGAQMAKELHYVPLSNDVVALVEQLWRSEVTVDGSPVWR